MLKLAVINSEIQLRNMMTLFFTSVKGFRIKIYVIKESVQFLSNKWNPTVSGPKLIHPKSVASISINLWTNADRGNPEFILCDRLFEILKLDFIVYHK